MPHPLRKPQDAAPSWGRGLRLHLECMCAESKLGHDLALAELPADSEALGDLRQAMTSAEAGTLEAKRREVGKKEPAAAKCSDPPGPLKALGNEDEPKCRGPTGQCPGKEKGTQTATSDDVQPFITPKRSGSMRMRLIPVQSGRIEKSYDFSSSQLGEGGFGSVRKARCLRTGFHYAVKTVLKKRITDVGAFQREFQIARSMDHPNIARIYESYEDRRAFYFVMELCEGGELFDRIVERGHLTEAEAATLVSQLARALCYMHHESVVHRDLKPENVLFLHKGPVGTTPIKLIDFGLARSFEEGEALSTKVGTPFYVAPEVLAGRYSQACDMWSLGVIVYSLLCGHPPFAGTEKEVLSQVRRGRWAFEGDVWDVVSEDAKDLISGLLRREPARRLTASEALGHDWTKHCAPNARKDHIGKGVVRSLHKFSEQTTFFKAALNVIAGQISDKKVRELKEIFLSIDANNNGTLTFAEVSLAFERAGLPRPARELLESVDMDRSGTINYTEFIAASLDRRLYAREDVCWHAFRVFDQNNDGSISLEELKKVLAQEQVQLTLGSKTATEIMREADSNKDGSVQFEEFVQMIASEN